MNTLDILFPIAATGTVRAIMQMIPLGLLAAYSLTLEITLNKFDRTFSATWWFFLAVAILSLSEIIWQSWTASTPMSDIIRYGESSSELTFSIIAFLVIVGAILLWVLFSGIRQVIVEAHGSGWGWAFLRLTPILPIAWFVFRAIVDGNAQVGDDGLFNLINR